MKVAKYPSVPSGQRMIFFFNLLSAQTNYNTLVKKYYLLRLILILFTIQCQKKKNETTYNAILLTKRSDTYVTKNNTNTTIQYSYSQINKFNLVAYKWIVYAFAQLDSKH